MHYRPHFTIRHASLLWVLVMGAATLLSLFGCDTALAPTAAPTDTTKTQTVQLRTWKICVESPRPSWGAQVLLHGQDIDTIQLRMDSATCRTLPPLVDTLQLELFETTAVNFDSLWIVPAAGGRKTYFEWEIRYRLHPDSLNRIQDSIEYANRGGGKIEL